MLHPQSRALLRLIEERGVPPTHTLTPEDARKLYRDRRAFTQPSPPEVAHVRDIDADGVALRLYRPIGSPAAAALPALVYYHGGGWTIGDLDTHDTLCRELCNGADCAVISVDYRLAPEHPFPAAVDDSMAALGWVHGHAADLLVDPSRIAVGGDSAGGNLAAVVSIMARDAGKLPIAFQLLIYPATDARCGHPSHVANGEGYLLTKDSVRYYLGHYLGSGSSDRDWRASPLLQPNLANLPSAFVLTAGYDPLRDEGLEYAQRLSESGNRASLVCFERQIHGFILMGRVIDEANVAVQLCASQLKRALQS
ncbi:MAG TPA: alpha/beta hydrolase [Ramlibacter sp.]|uniref:alpha/beta hydrolase n=1 Tax=Ramlibacter sp. TaxID=1917967 RepID=UPI002C80D447|nr:alpha/beta hydrolase [Ramlibacter sp.]HVZ46445.1 alpha/beta hydrolase [Ramlibacter sp.]